MNAKWRNKTNERTREDTAQSRSIGILGMRHDRNRRHGGQLHLHSIGRNVRAGRTGLVGGMDHRSGDNPALCAQHRRAVQQVPSCGRALHLSRGDPGRHACRAPVHGLAGLMVMGECHGAWCRLRRHIRGGLPRRHHTRRQRRHYAGGDSVRHILLGSELLRNQPYGEDQPRPHLTAHRGLPGI